MTDKPNPSSLLGLPQHVREKIYREVLQLENSIKLSVSNNWDTPEIIDDFCNSDTPTAWMWSMCPRITRFNLNSGLLRVNRQIYQEAAPLFGRGNVWVLLRLGHKVLASEMENSGCVIPIPEDWSLAGLGDMAGKVNRASIDITVGGEMGEFAEPQEQLYLTSVHGIWDLVAHLVAYGGMPWCILVCYRGQPDDGFPLWLSKRARAKTGRRIARMFEPLRLLGHDKERRDVRVTIENDWAGVYWEGWENRSKTPLTVCEALGMLRAYLPALNKEQALVNWADEEVRLAEWSFLFTHAILAYGVDEEVGRIWRDTLCQTHARLMVLRLAQGRLEEAKHHAQRTDALLETHEARLWWFRAIVLLLDQFSGMLAKTTPAEMLDLLWCLSGSEDRQWYNLFWLSGYEDEDGARQVVLAAAVKLQAVRILYSTRDVGERERAVFDALMDSQARRMVETLPKSTMDEHNLSMRALQVSNSLPDSFLRLCHRLRMPHWSLIERE